MSDMTSRNEGDERDMRLIEILNKSNENHRKKGEPFAASFVISFVTVHPKDCLVESMSDSNSFSAVRVGLFVTHHNYQRSRNKTK